MSGADPHYDLVGALDAAQSGYAIQPATIDAAYAQYAANGFTPLTSVQTAAVLLASAEAIQTAFETDVVGVILPPNTDPYPDALPPVFPAGLPRFPDSNEEPFDGWVRFGMDQEGFQF